MAALLQPFKLYAGLYSCRTSDPVRASNIVGAAPVLNETVQVALLDSPCNVWQTSKPKYFALNELSLKETNNTLELTADSLRPGGQATLFCRFQQFAVWHNLLSAHTSRQNGGSCFFSASTSKDTSLVSADPFKLVDDLSHHRNNSARNWWALVREN